MHLLGIISVTQIFVMMRQNRGDIYLPISRSATRLNPRLKSTGTSPAEEATQQETNPDGEKLIVENHEETQWNLIRGPLCRSTDKKQTHQKVLCSLGFEIPEDLGHINRGPDPTVK